MKSTVIKSFAKINIGLNITGFANGYHELDMVMVPIAFHDAVLLEKITNGRNNLVTVDDFSLSFNDKNIANKALNLLEKHQINLQDKYRITIHKVIPLSAGLAGGSSNAVATLQGVNKLSKLNLTTEQLIKLAEELGSDTPFFVFNKPMRCQGRGEKMTPITVKNDYYVLLVKPNEGCSTPVVYQKYDELTKNSVNIDAIVEALEKGDDDLLAKSLDNALIPAAESIVPEIKTIIDNLKQDGLKIVSMTGSGSTVFALSHDKKELYRIANKYEHKYFVEVTKIMK